MAEAVRGAAQAVGMAERPAAVPEAEVWVGQEEARAGRVVQEEARVVRVGQEEREEAKVERVALVVAVRGQSTRQGEAPIRGGTARAGRGSGG